MAPEEQQRIRRAAVKSKRWAKAKAEVQQRLADMDVERQALIGLLRSIENEEAKAKETPP